MVRHEESGDESRRELPKWAELYASNRVLPMVLMMFVGLIFTFVLVFGSEIILLPIKSGHPILIILSIVLEICVIAGLVWAMVTRRLSRMFQSLNEKLYGDEGMAVPPGPSPRVVPRWRTYLWMALAFASPFLIGLLVSFFLRFLHVPPVYIQPAMATIIVPLLVVLTLIGPDKPRWLSLIAPALYAIHAVLAVAGLRLSIFSTDYLAGSDGIFPTAVQLLEVYLPLTVYSLVTLLAKHIYSRYALLRLQIAALSPAGQFTEPNEEGNDNGDA